MPPKPQTRRQKTPASPTSSIKTNDTNEQSTTETRKKKPSNLNLDKPNKGKKSKRVEATEISKEKVSEILTKWMTREKSDLIKFYPEKGQNSIADRKLDDAAANMVRKLQEELNCDFEIALQFTPLVLYNLVVLIDDSITIQLKEDGTRKETLKLVLQEVAKIYSCAREKGIPDLRFFNTKTEISNFRPKQIEKLFQTIDFDGLQTRIGTELRNKIVKPLLYDKKSIQDMDKPLLILVLTDGGVEGERSGVLRKEVAKAISYLQNGKKDILGHHAVAFQFARVGDDKAAEELIKSLDNDPEFGEWIDCFPANDRVEDLKSKDKIERWEVLRKLMLGVLYKDIDENDDYTKDPEEDAAKMKVEPTGRKTEDGQKLDFGDDDDDEEENLLSDVDDEDDEDESPDSPSSDETGDHDDDNAPDDANEDDD